MCDVTVTFNKFLPVNGCSWNVFCPFILSVFCPVQCLQNIHLKENLSRHFNLVHVPPHTHSVSPALNFPFYCLPQPFTFSTLIRLLYNFSVVTLLFHFVGFCHFRIYIYCSDELQTEVAPVARVHLKSLLLIVLYSPMFLTDDNIYSYSSCKYKASYFVCPIAGLDLQLYSCNVFYDRLCHTNAWPLASTEHIKVTFLFRSHFFPIRR